MLKLLRWYFTPTTRLRQTIRPQLPTVWTITTLVNIMIRTIQTPNHWTGTSGSSSAFTTA